LATRSEGHLFDIPYTVEDVKANISKVSCFEGKNENPSSSADTFAKVNQNIDRMN